MKRVYTIPLLVLAGVLLVACTGHGEIPAGAARATFAVHCYDVGASALEGRAGVISVERGWSGLREVDRVVYDPRQVTVKQMEEWLRQADTYVKTLEPKPGREEEKE